MTNKVVREQIATWWRVSEYGAVLIPMKVVAFTSSFVTSLEEWSLVFSLEEVLNG